MGQAETVRQGKLGKMKLRLVRQDGRYYGLADGKKCTTGPNADQVWQQLHDEAGKSGPNYFGYDGARSRFLKSFPAGFGSEYFDSKERAYKLAASHRLSSAAPLSKALDGRGFGEDVLAVFRATNLLSLHEMTSVQNMLRSPGADRFVNAAAAFAYEGTEETLNKLEYVLKPHDCDKWTVATYLPFLWKPECHMFLKPTTTKDFADRVGHPFFHHYTPQLEFGVYESLLDLADRTTRELSDLALPRSLDHIDIQSFIWVVGNYPADPEQV